MQTNPSLLVQSMFQPALPPRKNDAHKGWFGSVAIIGGDTGMVGAVLLAARAALLVGAGRVYAAMLCKDAPVVDMAYPEIMMRTPLALTQLSQLNCLAIGPGLGQSPAAVELLEFWLTQPVLMVLDADALNLIAAHPHLAALVKNRQAETIITPHAGEAARLLATSTESVKNNRVDSAQQLAKILHVTCVLKGAGSVVALQDGRSFINITGNPALATGGTGDVLTGVMAGLMAQGVTAIDAAKLGVYVHGAAADNLVASGIGLVGLTASEVSLEVRRVINQLNSIG